MIYLACAYTHEDPNVMEYRFQEIEWDTAIILEQGIPVFCPVVYTHNMAKKYMLPITADYWEKFNNHILETCDEMWIKTCNDTEKSVGVQAEKKVAKKIATYRDFSTLLSLCSQYKSKT